MTEYQNTYNFDQFSDQFQESELMRLQIQAQLVSHLEQDAISRIGLPDGGVFVDLGCGPGFVTGEIAVHYPHFKVHGLDTSEQLLDVANSVVQPQHPNITFSYGDAYDTQLRDDSVDVVYSRLLYQHLEHPVRAMQEAKRILKPGGKLCVLDVDDQLQLFHPTLPSFQLLQEMAQEAQLSNGGNRHIGRMLPGLMEEAGLSDVQCIVSGLSTLDIGFDAFFDITVSFKSQIGGEEGKRVLAALREEVAALPSKPFGMAAIPVVIGHA